MGVEVVNHDLYPSVEANRRARVEVQSFVAVGSFGLRREGPARGILWARWRTRSQMAFATVGSARKSGYLSLHWPSNPFAVSMKSAAVSHDSYG